MKISLVMRSKLLDQGVGGDTRVAVIRDNGAWIDDPEYITNSEERVREFLKLTDALFLDSVDISIPPSIFVERLEKFRQQVMEVREKYLRYSTQRTLNRTLTDPTYRGDPYSKTFLGAVTTVRANGTFVVREETREEREKFAAIMELARTNAENYKGYELPKLLEGRKILYLGNEKVSLQPKSGSTG